jgi:hypothetical protein
MPAMNVLAGVIWHYWLAVPLVGGGVALCIATLAGYAQSMGGDAMRPCSRSAD